MSERISCVGAVCLAVLLLPFAAHAWEPNEKAIDDAVAGGDFGSYLTNTVQWLNAKAPAAVTADTLKSLLKDPVFISAVDQYRFISLCGPGTLGTFAKADQGNQAFLRWLLKDTGVMDLYLEAGGNPTGEGSIPTLALWSRIFNTDPDSRKGIYLKIAMATAVMRPVQFSDERSLGLTQPYEGRYLYYKETHKKGDLLPSFDNLSVWEIQKVVDGMGAPPADLTWVRDMVRTWRPDLIKANRIVKIVSEVRYGRSPLPIVDMASVLDAGGICGRRAYFGRKTCAAFGIPAVGISQPRHAALACKESGTWKVEYGADWWASTVDGFGDGPNFPVEAAARSHVVEFSQSEHLKWFASSLTATNPGNAIVELASKMIPAPADTKANAKEPETKSEMEANGVSKETSAARPATAPQEPISVEESTRIDADKFDKMSNLMVYDSWPDGTGKQVNFQKNLAESWIDYTIDVKKAGAYSLVLKLAAPNRDQVLNVAVGAGSNLTINVPNTRGLWGMTPPLDVKLEQGKQTLRISAPFQRGIAVKWLELKRM